MPYYLAPEIGSGTRLDPFRPVGIEQDGWSAIRLKDADGGARRLLYLPVHNTDNRLRQIADGKNDTLTGGVRNRLISDLKLTSLAATRFDQAMAEIMLNPPTGALWRIRPSRRTGEYSIFLGPKSDRLLWRQAAIGGGVSIADTFNRTNGDLDGSTSSDGLFTWDEFQGSGLSISSNQVLVADDNNDNYARAQLDMGTDDHYAQIELAAFTMTEGVGNGIDGGVIVRKGSPATFTCYAGYGSKHSVSGVGDVNEYRVTEITAGSFAVLASDTQDPAVSDVVKLEVDGSDLRLYVNTIEIITTSDGSITGNLRTGLASWSSTASNVLILDNFAAADVTAPPAGGAVRPRLFTTMGIGA